MVVLMKDLKENFLKIYKEERVLFWMMVALLVMGVGLMIFGLVNLRTGTAVVKVGYGDIGRYQGGEWSSMANSGGYHDGGWMEMLAFPIMAVILGVLHNLLTVKLFEKKGPGVAKLFVVMSIALVVATGLALQRLLGEG